MKNSIAMVPAALLGLLSLAPAVQADGVPGQGIWERSLQARELDGNLANGPEAFYDSTLNITWLANANLNGRMSWNAAQTWVSGLNINGVTGWRLPTIIDTGAPGCKRNDAGGSDCVYNALTKSGLPTKYQSGQTVYSEMAHLFYVTLGNNGYVTPGTGEENQADWGLSNTGGFRNLQPAEYWSATSYALSSESAWLFNTHWGAQHFSPKDKRSFALAVHPGDVLSAVPEPQTYAMLLLGLGTLLLLGRRVEV